MGRQSECEVEGEVADCTLDFVEVVVEVVAKKRLDLADIEAAIEPTLGGEAAGAMGV